MPLPTFHCPVCRNALSLEVVLANADVRECLLLLMDAHPSASHLLRPLLSYVGLFAPVKQQAIRYERMATLLQDLVPMIRSGQAERNGRAWPAPLEYWRQALVDVVDRAHGGSLKLPLKSHGYLLEIITQISAKADSKLEAALESQRAGHAGAGTPTERAQQSAVSSGLAPATGRPQMPADVREHLHSIVKKGATHG